MDEEDDDLFGWVSEVYSSEDNQPPTVDLTQYQVDYSINKEPTGEENLSYLEIKKKD